MVSGTRDTTVTFASNVLNAALALGTQGCLAWLLGPEGRGEYAVAIILGALLVVSCGLGVELAVVYFVRSGRMSLPQAVTGALVWSAISSGVALPIGVVLVHSGLAYFDKAPPGAFYLGLLYVPTYLAALVLTHGLIASYRLATFAVLNVAKGAVLLALTVGLVVGADLGVRGALIAVSASELLQAIAIAILLKRDTGAGPVRVRWETLRRLAGFGLRSYPGRLGRVVNLRVATVILGFLSTREQVGLYSAAVAIMARALLLADSIGTALLPRTSDDEGGRPDLVARGCRVSGVFSAGVLIVVLLLGEPLVRLVLSPAFLPAVPLMVILAVGGIFKGYARVLASYFNGTGRPGIVSVAVLVGVVVNVLLIPSLYRLLDLPGAALATAIAYTIEMTLASVFFLRLTSLRPGDLLIPRKSDYTSLLILLRRLPRRVLARDPDRG